MQDKNLKQKIKLWNQDFMLLLTEYHKIYKKNSLIPTINVLKFTKEYQNNNNSYADFANIYIQKSTNIDGISWIELKNKFISWYVENKDKNIPDAKEIKAYFEKKFFKEQISQPRLDDSIRIRGWKGYKLIDDNAL